MEWLVVELLNNWEMYKFFLETVNLNEATSYYINIIKNALEEKGEDVIYVFSLKEISPSDKVVVVSLKMFFYVWLKNRHQYIVNWYQGVAPEEALCDSEHSYIFRIIRKYLLRFIEAISLKYSAKNLFVSQSMRTHYQKKYGYKSDNYFIMPCFNQQLKEDYFVRERYQMPSFVYAGSLSKWQCVDRMFLLYKKIKALYPKAQFTILTKEQEKARFLCNKYDVKAVVKFVPVEALEQELRNFKYGFIVRDDIVVNNVATPTKMNSYMAAGVIPVYSNVIDDFKKVFANIKYVIPFSTDEQCLEEIGKIENTSVDLTEMISEYTKVFSSYYSVVQYTKTLASFLN